jgi:SAM-dependent methyltransferase
MLTIDLDRLGLPAGATLLDLGCGHGRHTFDALRRNLDVVAFDLDVEALQKVTAMTAAMKLESEVPARVLDGVVRGDALRLPFDAGSFDAILVSEVLEHIPDDRVAMVEISRVLKPGGRLAVSVPRWWTEAVCWALSDVYHDKPGGHVRIYRDRQLDERLAAAGFVRDDVHHAHALHSPYWWLRCAVGPERDEALLPSLYHRFLVWDLMRRPFVTRVAEGLLNPLLGKSVVMYLTKSVEAAHAA